MADLCLGSAQFGMHYGITNRYGRPKSKEVREMLIYAENEGVKYIDTAQAYGDSEVIIGENINRKSSLSIITKIPSLYDALSGNDIFNVLDSIFKSSLIRLCSSKIDGLLLHEASDFLHPNSSALLDWLESLVERKLVNKIGVSIYESFELEYLPIEKLNLIQLPISLFDQRLLFDGTISALKNQGIKIFARSIFMQGIILNESNRLPDFFSKDFIQHHSKFLEVLENDSLNSLEATFIFLERIESLDAFILGVNNMTELKSIINTWKKFKDGKFEFDKTLSNWHWNRKSDIDPRLWTH